MGAVAADARRATGYCEPELGEPELPIAPGAESAPASRNGSLSTGSLSTGSLDMSLAAPERSGELLPIGAILPDVLQRYQLQLP